MIPSSNAVLLITIARPSIANKKPASAPNQIDLSNRIATRVVTKTKRVPMNATPARQPKEFKPNICSPRAMIHLPIGGCATKEPTVSNKSVRPCNKNSFAFSTASLS